MRIYFNSIDRPKAVAKMLRKHSESSLSECSRAVAVACGYRDWHDLEAYIKSSPSIDVKLENATLETALMRYVTRIIDSIPCSIGDALYSAVFFKIFGETPPALAQQITVYCGILRNALIPWKGPFERGAVGYTDKLRGTTEPLIVKSFGREFHPTIVDALSNVSPNASITKEEFRQATQETSLFVPNCLYLPYGTHHERDGSEVLFSREYKPLWRIRPGKRPERLNPWEQIEAKSRSWLPGRDAPWLSKLDLTDEHEYLASREIVGLPKLVDALPDLILNDELKNDRDAIEFMHDQHRRRSERKHRRR